MRHQPIMNHMTFKPHFLKLHEKVDIVEELALVSVVSSALFDAEEVPGDFDVLFTYEALGYSFVVEGGEFYKLEEVRSTGLQ